MYRYRFTIWGCCCCYSSATRDAHPRRALVLAGLFASLAAWTKDEGIAFCAVIMMCMAAWECWQGRWGWLLRSLPWFVAGALPGLLAVASLKLWLAPHANPTVTQGASKAATRVWMAERWWFLLQALFQGLVDLGVELWSNPILLLAILAAALGVSIPAGYRNLGFSGRRRWEPCWPATVS